MRFQVSSILLFVFSTLVFAYSNGPPDNVVGNPTTCNQCHNSYALNSGGGIFNIDGLPESFYEPEKEYIVSIQIIQQGKSRFGFEATALLSKDFQKRAGEILVLETDLTQLSTTGDDKPQYIKHKLAGTFSGMVKGNAEWVFKWIAPKAGSGGVTFFFAGNAASNDNINQGDHIYSHHIILNESVSP